MLHGLDASRALLPCRPAAANAIRRFRSPPTTRRTSSTRKDHRQLKRPGGSLEGAEPVLARRGQASAAAGICRGPLARGAGRREQERRAGEAEDQESPVEGIRASSPGLKARARGRPPGLAKSPACQRSSPSDRPRAHLAQRRRPQEPLRQGAADRRVGRPDESRDRAACPALPALGRRRRGRGRHGQRADRPALSRKAGQCGGRRQWRVRHAARLCAGRHRQRHAALDADQPSRPPDAAPRLRSAGGTVGRAAGPARAPSRIRAP